MDIFVQKLLFCVLQCYLITPLTCFLYVCQVQMENRNFKSYTVQDLVNKIKKLRQKYKQEKDKSSRSGTGKRKKWRFFEIIDRTLCDKPQVKPPLVIDSSASSLAEHFASTTQPVHTRQQCSYMGAWASQATVPFI